MSEVEQQDRDHVRHRTLKEGLVSFHHDELTVPCTVRDESEAGAKLQFEGQVNLPESFYLTIPLDGAKWPAEVEWIKGMSCGVRFTGPAEPSNIHHHQFIKAWRPGPDEAPEADGEAAPAHAEHHAVHRKPFGRRK
ncbi:MAG: hypothetical protein CL534_04730 [Ahrensia sp.]|nr:hypothetical protein [Ahrensia sp.]